MATTSVAAGTHIAAIFARSIHLDEANLSPEGARDILCFRLVDTDRERFHQLAQKRQQGQLTAKEDEEMDHYLCLDVLLSLLHSKARKSLKNSSAGE